MFALIKSNLNIANIVATTFPPIKLVAIFYIILTAISMPNQ